MRRIILSNHDTDTLLAHASDKMPNESCAILLGRDDRVTEVFLADNAERSPVAFAISPEQLLEAYMAAEAKGLDVVGIFHSHPSSQAYPSETDKRFMQSNPVVWIIYSGVHDFLAGYVLGPDGRVAEVEVVRAGPER